VQFHCFLACTHGRAIETRWKFYIVGIANDENFRVSGRIIGRNGEHSKRPMQRFAFEEKAPANPDNGPRRPESANLNKIALWNSCCGRKREFEE